MNLNSFSFPKEQIDHNDHDQHHQSFNLGPNHQLVTSSSPSCHFLFGSAQDRVFYHHQLYQPHHQEDENYPNHGGPCYEIKNNIESRPKIGVWKKEDQGPARIEKDNRMKWLSTKMRMKNSDRASTTKIEVQKLQTSSSLETDNISSNGYSSSYIPIRVCSDCHTTKTPLWRSGPKGPKSLCNACGIRQRKARRAMAAAAAAATGTVVASDQPPVQYKAKMTKDGHSSQFKKCRKVAANGVEASESSGKKKLGFEDFLINLSNKLALHRVFPEDEKDAAILLMALSSGLLHG